MFDVEVVTDSFPFNGGTANLVIAHDVTERRALEAQLRQAQKIEAVGMLAGGIAHDFNNILTAIHAHAGFLRESLDGNDERNEDVEEIAKAAERASGLTRQLLAFSRKQILKPTVLDINVVVTQLEKMLGRLLGEDIRMAVTCSDTLDRVLADPSQIEQVLINLAINARDAMPKGGTLSINTTNVEVNRADAACRPGLTPGHYVRLIVSDDGGGMPESIRARIFEPFFTTKESGQGTGLGLSTVYGIVKQSGGYIHVASEVNRGTTFEILLPRSDEVAPERQAPDLGSRPSHAGATVLLVEDEVAVRSVASRILQRAGYVVLEAKDGRDAVRLASSHTGSIDLVLTDAVMPDLGGAEVARAVEEARPRTPILFMSGYTEDEIIRRHILMDTGMFLEKPFTPESLKNAVRSALEARVTAEAEV